SSPSRCTAISRAPRPRCWGSRWRTRLVSAARRTCPAPPRSTQTGASRWPTATGGRSCWKTCPPTRACAPSRPRSARLAVTLLAAQRPLEPVPPLDEQAAQRRRGAGGGDQVVGRLDHRAAVGDRVGVGHEPLGHVGAPVPPDAADHLEVAPLVRLEQFGLVGIGEGRQHPPEHGGWPRAAADLLPGAV